MVEAGKHMPLPVAKPNIPDDDVKKDEVKKEDGKAKAEAGKVEGDAKAPKKSRRQAGPARARPGS
jgi:hypothetical protein